MLIRKRWNCYMYVPNLLIAILLLPLSLLLPLPLSVYYYFSQCNIADCTVHWPWSIPSWSFAGHVILDGFLFIILNALTTLTAPVAILLYSSLQSAHTPSIHVFPDWKASLQCHITNFLFIRPLPYWSTKLSPLLDPYSSAFLFLLFSFYEKREAGELFKIFIVYILTSNNLAHYSPPFSCYSIVSIYLAILFDPWNTLLNWAGDISCKIFNLSADSS